LSPEVDTGWIADSAALSYSSTAGALNDNTTYWWRVEVRDSFNTESGWTCGDTSFTTLVCSPQEEECGLRGYNGASTIHFACELLGTVTSPLRIRAGDNNNYGVVLVDPSDPDASKFRILTSAGVKALKIYSGACSPDCTGKVCGDDGCGGSCGTCDAYCSGSTRYYNGICSSGSCTYSSEVCPYGCSGGVCLGIGICTFDSSQYGSCLYGSP